MCVRILPKAPVVSLSKILNLHNSLLVDYRNWFEHVVKIKLE